MILQQRPLSAPKLAALHKEEAPVALFHRPETPPLPWGCIQSLTPTAELQFAQSCDGAGGAGDAGEGKKQQRSYVPVTVDRVPRPSAAP